MIFVENQKNIKQIKIKSQRNLTILESKKYIYSIFLVITIQQMKKKKTENPKYLKNPKFLKGLEKYQYIYIF